jgi:hypothetical protein
VTAVIIGLLFAANVGRAQGIRFYSSVSRGGQVPAEWIDAAKIIYPSIVEFNAPKTWTWILVCDEAAWKQVGGTYRQTNLTGQILALSNLDSHMTYIRGNAVLHPFGERVEFSPRHTIAHEFGHILLHTTDEDRAEKMADELMSARLVARVP